MTPVAFSQSMAFTPKAEFFLTIDGKVVKTKNWLPESTVGSEAPHDGVRAVINSAYRNGCRANIGNYIRSYLNNRLKPALKPTYGKVLSISLTGRDGLRAAKGTFDIRIVPVPDLKIYGDRFVNMGAVLKAHDERIPLMLDATIGLIWTILEGKPREMNHTWADGVLTYNTLSNGWFRAYPLMSMTFGLARWCCLAVEQSSGDKDYVTPVLSLIERDDVIKAITTGDRELARSLWSKIENEVASGMGTDFGNLPLKTQYLPEFRHFLDKGLDHWFKHDIMNHWSTMPDGHGRGWENFIGTTVAHDLNPKPASVQGVQQGIIFAQPVFQRIVVS